MCRLEDQGGEGVDRGSLLELRTALEELIGVSEGVCVVRWNGEVPMFVFGCVWMRRCVEDNSLPWAPCYMHYSCWLGCEQFHTVCMAVVCRLHWRSTGALIAH